MTSTCSVCGRRFEPRSIRTVAPDHPVCSRPACRKRNAKRNVGTVIPEQEHPDPLWVQAENGVWTRI